MSISDERLMPFSRVMGMQEVIRGFNKTYSKIVGFTINTDYSQNEIYQICALMYSIVNKFGTENYILNIYLNALKYYLLNHTKPCNDINEYDACKILGMSDDLPDSDPNAPV